MIELGHWTASCIEVARTFGLPSSGVCLVRLQLIHQVVLVSLDRVLLRPGAGECLLRRLLIILLLKLILGDLLVQVPVLLRRVARSLVLHELWVAL